MSGRPFLQDLNRRIETLGGDDYVFDRIAAGESIGAIAQDLGVSRPYLYTWRNQGGGDLAAERKRRWEEAIEMSADAKEEEGAEILDELAGEPVVTSSQVQLATSRANYRRWQAETRNRTKYGKEEAVQVNLSIGSLHLDALRARGSARVLEPANQVEELPAEIVEVEE